jgi:hypothetical protein
VQCAMCTGVYLNPRNDMAMGMDGMGYGHTNEGTGTDGATGTDGDGTVGYFKTLQPKVQC